ncbi:hypothetical protein J2S74_005312 [Evansella vedderi]|uniref:AAA+ ATPase domain-containing protein n=1 Tax=Evansella vedderi TaxID=38282 RepID=A0ABU0A2Y1_9BACI|nr:AAA domain-containing protein [Evansella vedderi]MDQ0257849.1 hypothetical protein [Evansella vedderi]
MLASDISFGQQLQYNAATKTPLEEKYEGLLVKMVHSGNSLFLDLEDGATSLVEVFLPDSTFQHVIHDLEYYKDACLIRIEGINQNSILFTTIKFSDTVHFSESESLKFVINKAIEFDLNKYAPYKDPIQFFEDEFLLDDLCFVRSNDNGDKVTLIGTQYMSVFQRTKQNILQAIQIIPLQNRAAVYGKILVFKGSISFQNHLNNAQLSYETNRKYQESLKDTQELLKLWNLYSELETEAAKEQIEEIGSLKYTSTFSRLSDNNRLIQVFYIDNKPSSSFLNSDVGYAVASAGEFNKDDITRTKSTFIGTVASLSKKRAGDQYELTLELEEDSATIPTAGYILGSFTGSKIMAQRRDRALQKILDGKTPLVNLKVILQSGASDEIVMKHKKGVNEELSRRIFGTKKISFTERQKEAIGIAINTPDMAIIQGPPGTGKTTVIRAIISRLNKIHDGDVRVLVSSAQHDAVDNAIENVEYGGLPANRIGGKKQDKTNVSNQSILKWIGEISNNCDVILAREENGQARLVVREILLLHQKIYKDRKDPDAVLPLLNQMYPLMRKISVEQHLIEQMEKLLKNNGKENTNDSTVVQGESEIVPLLQRQRLTFESFIDDGRDQLTELVRYSRSSIELEIEIPSVWNELRLAVDSDEIKNLLPSFKVSVETYLDQFEVNIACDLDEDLFELDVISMLDDLKSYFEQRFNKGIQTLSDILWDFKDQLENPGKISDLINKYTKINAATCQQSVLTNYSGLKIKTNTEYDYVIIDEAARANPLDLLIPMSLGKHIILVGDHKQLPHLLEDEVVNSLLEHKNDPEIRELLNEPLFSRLFNMLEKTKLTSHKRTVMLVDQYRMHPKISKFVSDCFYEGALLSTHVTEEQKAHNLQRYNYSPIAWINVPKSNGKEYSVNGQSKSRKSELEKVMKEINGVLDGNQDYSIGIITFYKKQALDLQDEISKLSLQDQSRIEVGTVDSFQGKEFDVVILSTVRSNNHRDKKKRVGFLDSRNRLNVAFSRGKRLLIVVGDAETVALDEGKIVIQELYDFYQLCRKEGYCE